MPEPYRLGLAPGVTVSDEDGALTLVNLCGRVCRITAGDRARRLVGRLGAEPVHADDLAGEDPARLYYLLIRLADGGMLSHTLTGDGWSARLDPTSPRFRATTPEAGARLRLSRFALMRRIGGQTAIECPLGHARVVLLGAAPMAMAGLLHEPRSAAELAEAAGVPAAEAEGFMGLLAMAGAAFVCDAPGRLPEDDDEALRQWTFHDLLFHTHTRLGRREAMADVTFRFKGAIKPLPCLKPPMSDQRIALPGPDGTEESHPFAEMAARRRSRRDIGAPITLEALGHFLHRSARVQETISAPLDYDGYAVSHRPAASGGGSHALDLYLTVARADGLEPGFYHYAADDHALERLGGLAGAPTSMLATAAGMAMMPETPDVLITLAARFARLSWKYQEIAYALALREAGTLVQQMYLAATDLGLRPCAIGSGDSDLFAEATGLDYYAETSVAEFILSGA